MTSVFLGNSLVLTSVMSKGHVLLLFKYYCAKLDYFSKGMQTIKHPFTKNMHCKLLLNSRHAIVVNM